MHRLDASLMKINDFLMFTFECDMYTNNVSRIIGFDPSQKILECELVDTLQKFQIEYSFEMKGSWKGKREEDGKEFVIDVHHLYTPASFDLKKQGVAAVFFPDNRWYLGYVIESHVPIHIFFYHRGQPQIMISENVITASNWDLYPVGSHVSEVVPYVYDKG